MSVQPAGVLRAVEADDGVDVVDLVVLAQRHARSPQSEEASRAEGFTWDDAKLERLAQTWGERSVRPEEARWLLDHPALGEEAVLTVGVLVTCEFVGCAPLLMRVLQGGGGWHEALWRAGRMLLLEPWPGVGNAEARERLRPVVELVLTEEAVSEVFVRLVRDGWHGTLEELVATSAALGRD